jgi:hypothetical protein
MKKFVLSFMTLVMAFIAMAQEEATKVDINLNKEGGGGNWYTSPWVWVAGAALFILLLVALTSGGGSRRRTTTTSSTAGDRTITKTVERED